MWNLNYDSPGDIDRVLKENSLNMCKKFGQNFLINRVARERLLALFELEDGMKVWEIGPGLGALTHLVLKNNVNLTAFEIDRGFIKILNDIAFNDEENFSLVEGDALKTLFKKRYLPLPDRIIGNLPYNVGSVIIAKLIENNYTPPLMVFTLQREVVDRMIAKRGEKDYSSFSLLTQIDYINQMAIKLPRSYFWPQPNVDSAVVVMHKRNKPLVEENYRRTFLTLLRVLFSSRRKTIRNNLLSSIYGNEGRDVIEDILQLSSLTGSERAENLSVEEIVQLAKVIQERI